MNMKKRIVSALALLVLVFSLTALGKESTITTKNEENRYSMSFSLNGNDLAVGLTLRDESSAVLTAGYDFTCGYEREGSAVRLSLCEEAKDEKASMWDQLPHDYLLDQEQHALTAIQGAYAADLFTFYFLDDSSLLVEYVNGNALWSGFSYHTDDEYLYPA